MKLSMFYLDAFTNQLFKGNPAAVCPLDKWLPDSVMQSIAAENNLAETAFFVPEGSGFHLRWFTPTVEIDLCGHATLASAHVLFKHLDYNAEKIQFNTLSGPLFVYKSAEQLVLDFPGREVQPMTTPVELLQNFSSQPLAVLSSGTATYIVVLSSADDVKNYRPDFVKLAAVDRCVNITARGSNCDFVSRFFGPNIGIPEDPVTGSAHCGLAIYWSRILNKTKNLHGIQLSARTGEIFCSINKDRVHLSGHVVDYMQGTVLLSALI